MAVPPREAVADIRLRAPARGKKKLQSLLHAATADDQLKAWWVVQQTNAERLAS